MPMNSLYGYGQNVAKAISSNTRGTFVEVGVGLRFVRDLELGKETLRLDKLNKFLDFFNYGMVAISKENKQ